jgi:hypothetical protein
MGLCKGNRGNLMQHWTLCECLSRLNSHYDRLHFVSTHSMAPWSVPVKKIESDHCRDTFCRAGQRLIERLDPSAYEIAWRSLSLSDGVPYPSSAQLVCRTWSGDLSLALCEYEHSVSTEIEGWLDLPQTKDRSVTSVLMRGDWRVSIGSPLVKNTEHECIYIEMDPMRYDSRRKRTQEFIKGRKTSDPQAVYPEDMEGLMAHLSGVTEPIIIQLSSFSTQNANSLDRKRESLGEVLLANGFGHLYETAVGDQMASFVFHRSTPLQNENLADAFSRWLSAISK